VPEINADRRRKGRSQYDLVVERCTKTEVHQRRMAAECVKRGHDWANVTSEGQVVWVMCRRCCAYQKE